TVSPFGTVRVTEVAVTEVNSGLWARCAVIAHESLVQIGVQRSSRVSSSGRKNFMMGPPRKREGESVPRDSARGAKTFQEKSKKMTVEAMAGAERREAPVWPAFRGVASLCLGHVSVVLQPRVRCFGAPRGAADNSQRRQPLELGHHQQ